MNKNDRVVTKDNYKQIVLRRMIMICWILLAICFIVKIFGGNFFNIVCNNQRFIKVCTYIDNTFWYFIVGFIFSYIGNLLLWFSMKRMLKCSFKEFIILTLIILVLYIIQYIFQSVGWLSISLIMSIIKFILIPLFIFKINWKNVLIVNVFDIGFQLISSFTKGISISNTIYDSALIGLIFLIDYFIMITLLYLYSYNTNKKGEYIMGFLGSWFLHKDIAELEALLPTLKNEDEKKACEKRIAELKAKKNK